MAKSKSSNNWLKEHFDDYYVHKAKQEGWRSRAIYKLQEIDEKDRLFHSGMTVIDLGAAPGGWSQWTAQKIGENGQVFALDILPVEPYAGVTFVQGDFQEESVYNSLLEALADREVDLVMSDMAPNMTGNKGIDTPRSMYLVELTMDLAQQVLKPKGTLLMKVFQGTGYDQLLKTLRQDYTKVLVRKPKASRSRSKEVYLLAQGKK
ncbi:MAG: 23S rRNA (uridine(2552)-2'-O)-methyltransferase RlmE [Piscirickettsiaceae bacterium CG_4_9_14_3_um_filter_43_564]|nr:23S rRNA (uridine(2552)-2'-O)-methyltransferase RlmE [Thiomicrospira sp.]OIP94207.1 MAG: 23S rRNA methyltransferase [Thiomicrospira sp. CG2_30_44_34]PIQ05421.1 MAG: 23S rRNA (uridine(2552)-2'-O)-methyltransferase RlmE [Piscirickettsiaceae bacterium CG18_big_fil_WC_8_21_14_2_50_44_103]PIU38269.1 MAG: 23S rRNA (uridine(2552)-2'-O)-methyltransferase RlmE [Piscirickettsiaceae bacterium CG07_land_8_20_14_0_80_44_28]PIW57612.1 MAG: 23S rRNA (uridine(2552)-2'-O)-methyltransferase RlmE [Piscirickett